MLTTVASAPLEACLSAYIKHQATAATSLAFTVDYDMNILKSSTCNLICLIASVNQALNQRRKHVQISVAFICRISFLMNSLLNVAISQEAETLLSRQHATYWSDVFGWAIPFPSDSLMTFVSIIRGVLVQGGIFRFNGAEWLACSDRSLAAVSRSVRGCVTGDQFPASWCLIG